MAATPRAPAKVFSVLEQISTRWPLISDPLQFVLRYAPAARRYLGASIKDAHDAEDAAQSFLLRMVDRPFTPGQVHNGRFRDYLKAVLRNLAHSHYRRLAAQPLPSMQLDRLPASSSDSNADSAWLTEWRQCLLVRTWERLEEHERQAPQGLAYTVLRLATDHDNEDCEVLARRASARSGRTIRTEAFRKQLSRARRRFAQLLVHEVRQTLERPGAAEVLDELRELGLMPYVRDFLPRTYREAGLG